VVDFGAELLSSVVGVAMELILLTRISGAFEIVGGSFEWANPSLNAAEFSGYEPIPDSLISMQGRFVRIDFNDLDSTLANTGLVGSKDIDRNKISVRYKGVAGCGRSASTVATFVLYSRNSCGDLLPQVFKRSARYTVNLPQPGFRGNMRIANQTIDACSDVALTLPVSGIITGGETQAVRDSVAVTIPPGFSYVPGSYNPILNVVSGEPVITTSQSNETVLTWSAIELVAGDLFSFNVDIVSDGTFECGDADWSAGMFGEFTAICSADGSTCAFRSFGLERERRIIVEKPEPFFNACDLDVSLNPTTGTATLDLEAEICNNGADVNPGDTLNYELWEDIDGNGVRSPADTLVTTIPLVSTLPIPNGSCMTFMETVTVEGGSFCSVIGVLNPETSCICEEIESPIKNIEFDIDFDPDYEVCSRDVISIGPDQTDGYDYQWVTVEGSDLGLLSSTTMTPTDFSQQNTTGMDIITEYALRTSVGMCFTFDTVSITVFPEEFNEISVQACDSSSFPLPAPPVGGSNFQWMPSDGLSFPGPDSGFAVVDTVMGDQTYTLDYVDANGCPASQVVNLTAVDCGTALTALGDTVWFDFDRNGLQDPGEPGIEGVVVNLYDGLTGTIISSTVTDENGRYFFDELPAGTYFVEFVPLPGFVPTMSNEADDFNDSDADEVTGRTQNYFLPIDSINLTIDAGFIPDCSIELDVQVVGCVPSDSGLVNQIDVNVVWDGNPYTYDQFFGEDSLLVDILGETYVVIADTLFGDTTLTVFAGNSFMPGSLVDAFARFTLNDMCEAMDDTTTFDPCTFDLALRKTSTNGSSFAYGDTICLNIEVFNQGVQTATNIEIIDYNPPGFGFIPSANPDWTQLGDNLVQTIPGPLEPGNSVSIPLKVEFLQTSGGAEDWLNFAEITAFQDTFGMDQSDFDIDSTPDDMRDNDSGGNPGGVTDDTIDGDGIGGGGSPRDDNPFADEDDQDPFFVEVLDLALRKILATPPPYAYGDLITFDITIFNQGSVSADTVKINDYIPEGFAFVPASNPDWMAMDSLAMTFVAQRFNPGDSATVSITLELLEADADQYVNYAEIAQIIDTLGNTRFDDIDSTPDNDVANDAGGNPDSDSDNSIDGDGRNGGGSPLDSDPDSDEDDHDPAFVNVPIIELTKTTIDVVPAASGVAGNFDATLEFIVENDGNAKLSCIQLTDDLIEQLGDGFKGITSAPAIIPDSTTADTIPTLNAGYNGGVIDEIFVGDDGCLQPDQTIGITMTIEVMENGLDPLINEATVSGKDTFGTTVMDMDTAVIEIPDCFLDVTCPNPHQGQFECLSDVPAMAMTIADFMKIDGFSAVDTMNSCGEIVFEASEEDNMGSGCIGDTLIITRTYVLSDTVKINGVTVLDSMDNPIVVADTCEVTYKVVDDENPTIVCPSSEDVQCSIDEVPVYETIDEFIAAGGFLQDNCGLDTLILLSEVSDGETCPETVVRTYQVTDSCGNASTCAQTITIEDTRDPDLSCLPLTSDCSIDLIPAYTSFAEFLADGNTADDNCGLDTATFMLVSEINDGNSCPEIVERKYSIADSCGNVATSKQLITLNDNTPPMVVFPGETPSDTTINCDAVVPDAVALAGTDNCGVVTTAIEETSTQTSAGLCTDYTYTITRAYIVTDECGNESSVIQTINVQDTVPPTAVCCMGPLDVVLNETGMGSITINDVDCGSFDNCTPGGELDLMLSQETFTLDDVGTNTVVLTVTDACGLSSTCEITVNVLGEAVIGLAKRVVSVVNNPEGSSDITYEFNVENLGNLPIDSIQIEDILPFADPCMDSVIALTSDDFIVNAGYDGDVDPNLLIGSDDLPVGDKGAVLLTVRISGMCDGTFDNQATVTGVGSDGMPVEDESTDGSDPDPDGDDDPMENDVTPVTIDRTALIGAAKRVADATLNSDGSFEVTYEINVENFGDVNVDSIQVTDDLVMTFGAPCAIQDIILTSDDFTVNPDYDGDMDTDLLAGDDDLPVGDQGAILITVLVDSCGSTGPFENEAVLTGVGPDGEL